MAENLSSGKEEKEKLSIKVLLADDDEGVLALATRILKGMGCAVETVKNGQEVIDRLQDSVPGEFGLLITDNDMPLVKGVDALEKIHTDVNLRTLNLPAILNSSGVGEDGMAKIKEYGAVFLQKPWNMQAYKNAVFTALGANK